MVFVLHRYVFRELLKILIPATVALTLIMSLLSILRPIQEYGIGPGQVIPILGYSLPITLTFVLPLSALFAVAMVYGRFASDNELDACKASGISLWTLVYPGLALAIMVAIANLVLSFHVVPTYVQYGEAAIKADAKQILFRNIQRRGYYELPPKGKYILYADQASLKNNMLYGVVVLSIDGEQVGSIITAESASVKFSSHGRLNEVQIIANRLYRTDADNEQWFYSERFRITDEFPSLLGDNIQFKKIGEMKRIQANPMEFHPIESAARNSYTQLITEVLAQDVNAKIADGNESYYQLIGEPNSVLFRADSCRANTNPSSDAREIYLSGNVEIQQYDTDDGRFVQKWSCSQASLLISDDEYPTIKMDIYSPRWQKPDGSEGFAAGHRFIQGLLLPAHLQHELEARNILNTASPRLDSSLLKAAPSAKLTRLQDSFKKIVSDVLIDIKAEIHTRLALGICCVPLILIGVALGIIFRGGHLLTAFGISAAPAMLLVVCLMMGKNVAKHPDLSLASGLMLIWSAFFLLSLLAGLLYRRLLKN